eukprot:CAMPEP_0198331810 /NCGR_PEP_ID=MMETSP1450-20131203/17852_1 /TAXON_ID=753684 ORGANISM="Madagascaria erythrocladiodes, Strain CCMP3234" /NCGR_SAMPLE_ID=MMETSP1450 /ASSEMBLY_ACC=CAM_ASM_001115 /LENGTH=196 /DNA_ID=CAMNT_0044036223 /DNA_START=179 /DNA_END=765 /DNA_ORIENTATION=+
MRYLTGTNVLTLSVWKLTMMITTVAMPDQVAVASVLQAVFVGVALVVPLLTLLTLLLLWVVPLPRRVARVVLFVAEVLHAWSALDVLVVALCVALVEIGQFTRFVIGTRCDALNALFARYAMPIFELQKEPPVCFDVHTVLLRGVSVLGAACAAYFVFTAVVMAACSAALHEQHQGDDDGDDDGDGDGGGGGGGRG